MANDEGQEEQRGAATEMVRLQVRHAAGNAKGRGSPAAGPESKAPLKLSGHKELVPISLTTSSTMAKSFRVLEKTTTYEGAVCRGWGSLSKQETKLIPVLQPATQP